MDHGHLGGAQYVRPGFAPAEELQDLCRTRQPLDSFVLAAALRSVSNHVFVRAAKSMFNHACPDDELGIVIPSYLFGVDHAVGHRLMEFNLYCGEKGGEC